MKLFGEWVIIVRDKDGKCIRLEIFSNEYRQNIAAKRLATEFPNPPFSIQLTKFSESLDTFHGLSSRDMQNLADDYDIPAKMLERLAEVERRRIVSTLETIRFLLEKYTMVIRAVAAFMLASTLAWLSEHYEVRLAMTSFLRSELGIRMPVLLDGRNIFGASLVSFASIAIFLRMHLGDWVSGLVATVVFFGPLAFAVYIVVNLFEHFC